jgi:hypothetical protein
VKLGMETDHNHRPTGKFCNMKYWVQVNNYKFDNGVELCGYGQSTRVPCKHVQGYRYKYVLL